MTSNQYSAGPAEFLANLRVCDELFRIAQDDEKRADDETQDILHSLELDKHTYNETAKLGKKLTEVRQRRRKAKDVQESLYPAVSWVDQNKPVVKAMERVLGEMRRVEKKQENRLYAPRTDVLEDDT